MLDPIRSFRLPWLTLPLVLTGAMAPPALADDSSAVATESPTTLQEVTVTAQKVKQNLQAVGISITALNSQTLNRLGVTDVTQLASQVPGMQFNQFSPTITVFNLRGVSQNDFSDEQEAPIAVYEDGVYVASMGALAGSMFDLERVEVLRGPQGTLFGRNATGGLIQYISNKPEFDTDGNLAVTAGNYGTWDSEGAFNTVLTDKLAMRVSFATDYHDGYITNQTGPGVEDQNQYAGRVQLLYKPTEKGEFLLKLYGMNNDHETGAGYSWAATTPNASGRGVFIGPNSTANCPDLYGGCTPGGDLSGYRNSSNSPFDQSYGNNTGIFNRTVAGATLNATWDFQPFTLTSVTDYQHMQKRYGEDSAIAPEPDFTYDTLQHFHQLSQELRLNGAAGGLKWITGLYFLDLSMHDWGTVFALPVIGGMSGDQNGLTTRSEAAFGQLQYALSRRFTGILGLRYSSDQKAFDYVYANAPQPTLVYDEATNPDAKHTYDNVSGKAELDYAIQTDSMLYASVNRGAKAGGWSAPVNGVIDPDTLPYKQETLTSYEIGEKLTFWEGRARLNGDVFYYNYQNYQGFFTYGLTDVVRNVDAHAKGGELEFAWLPFRGANVQLGVSHLETRAERVPLPVGALTTTEMPQAPKWSVNVLASYDWWLSFGKLSLEADTKYNSNQYMELINAPADHVGGYAVSNARVSYSSLDGHWEVASWVRNLADKWYPVYGLDLSSLGFEQYVYGAPRTYGATVTFKWGP